MYICILYTLDFTCIQVKNTYAIKMPKKKMFKNEEARKYEKFKKAFRLPKIH